MDNIDKLSLAEKEIMDLVWTLNKKVTSGELLKIFNEEKNKSWSAQTVSTFLTRIADKGILTSNKQGRINYYIPALSKEEYERYQAEDILTNLYNGSLKNFLSALYYKRDITNEDYKEITDWFSKK